MSGLKRCVACHQLSDPRAVSCWVCGGGLVEASTPPTHPALPGENDGVLRLFAWLVLILGIAFVSLLVGVELALNWPGLLIPFALVMVIGFGAIGRTAYVHVKASKAPSSPVNPRAATAAVPQVGAQAGPAQPSTGEAILQGLAIAATVVAVVLGLLLLLGVAAIVLFLMVCFAILGVGGMH